MVLILKQATLQKMSFQQGWFNEAVDKFLFLSGTHVFVHLLNPFISYKDLAYPPVCDEGVFFVITTLFPSFDSRSTL